VTRTPAAEPANAPHSPPAPAHAHPHHSTLARAVRAVAGVTLLSRLGGLVRDVILVRVFGATVVGSAFQAAFAIPNMFRRLFGEGALSAAFIPEYTDATKAAHTTPSECPRCGYHLRGLASSTCTCPECAGPLPVDSLRESGALASLTLRWLALVTTALTVLAEVVLAVLLVTLPPDPSRELSLKLIMVMLPFMPLICSVAILAGMLQVHAKFAASATGPLVLNTFIIAVGAYFLFSGTHATETAAYVIGIATVLSGGTQAVWFARLLRPHVVWGWADVALGRPRAARMFKKFVPVLVGLGTLQLSALLDTCIAMWPIWVGQDMFGHAVTLDKASNVILAAAQRLYQFPLGVFGVAVATAVFPLLAHAASDAPRFTDTLRRGIRLSLFISLPATAGLVFVGRELCAVLYSGGHRGFGPADVDRCANVLAGYSAAIWAYSLNHVLTRAFFASKDTRTPMHVALVFAAINLATNLTLIWPLREAGLAWSTAACATLQAGVLTLLIRRRLHVRIFDGPTLAAALRLLAVTFGMALCVAILQRLWPWPDTWSRHLARLAVASVLGGVVYGALSALTRAPELHWLLRPQRPDALSAAPQPSSPPPAPPVEFEP
jgi:putative peptidoglycan lipid II flippase